MPELGENWGQAENEKRVVLAISREPPTNYTAGHAECSSQNIGG